MIGPVRRTLLLSMLSFAAIGFVGSGTCAIAGATTPHPRPLCIALKPGVRAGQRIPSTVAATRTQTLAKSKNDLLADINVVLKALNSVKSQMRSASAEVRGSFDRVLALDENFKKAVQRASTKRQITLASRTLGSSTAKVVTFDAYIASQCEGSAPAP
jgi:hypothetical protein